MAQGPLYGSSLVQCPGVYVLIEKIAVPTAEYVDHRCAIREAVTAISRSIAYNRMAAYLAENGLQSTLLDQSKASSSFAEKFIFAMADGRHVVCLAQSGDRTAMGLVSDKWSVRRIREHMWLAVELG